MEGDDEEFNLASVELEKNIGGGKRGRFTSARHHK